MGDKQIIHLTVKPNMHLKYANHAKIPNSKVLLKYSYSIPNAEDTFLAYGINVATILHCCLLDELATTCTKPCQLIHMKSNTGSVSC